jgi:hypothetical protein
VYAPFPVLAGCSMDKAGSLTFRTFLIDNHLISLLEGLLITLIERAIA